MLTEVTGIGVYLKKGGLAMAEERQVAYEDFMM